MINEEAIMFHTMEPINDTRWRNVAVGPFNAPGAKDSAERDGMEIHGGREWLQPKSSSKPGRSHGTDTNNIIFFLHASSDGDMLTT
jgi:hypothetical protein